MDLESILYLAQDALLGAMVVIMLALTAVGITSYRRTKVKKIALVAAALAMLAIKAAFTTALLYMGMLDTTGLGVMFIDTVLVLDFVAAVTLYIAIFRY